MMKLFFLFFTILLSIAFQKTIAQVYPTFGPEKKVTITGLTFDAMEPFISLDENILFFNSLNSGGNTNIYYATKVNDSTYNYVGLLGGTYDSSVNHLDAVASIDSLNNFFWTSLRAYPLITENLHKGIYVGGNVANIKRVYGDFNIYSFNYPYGWLIMDASINYQSNLLYYCNAKFDFSNTSCTGVPCESKIGVAQKINDTLFNKHPNTAAILNNINDTINYIVYAPQVTKDGVELYYTRLQKNTFNTEICVAVRTSTSSPFSLPKVIHSNIGYVPEAASPTSNKQKIYYHQKDITGKYSIYVRYRLNTTDLNEFEKETEQLIIYPNPTCDKAHVFIPNPKDKFTLSIFSVLGAEIYKTTTSTIIDTFNLENGIYVITVSQGNKKWSTKFVKD